MCVTNNRLQKLLRESILFFCTVCDVKHDSGECMPPCKRIYVCEKWREYEKWIDFKGQNVDLLLSGNNVRDEHPRRTACPIRAAVAGATPFRRDD